METVSGMLSPLQVACHQDPSPLAIQINHSMDREKKLRIHSSKETGASWLLDVHGKATTFDGPNVFADASWRVVLGLAPLREMY
jgi:hypothetical protein